MTMATSGQVDRHQQHQADGEHHPVEGVHVVRVGRVRGCGGRAGLARRRESINSPPHPFRPATGWSAKSPARLAESRVDGGGRDGGTGAAADGGLRAGAGRPPRRCSRCPPRPRPCPPGLSYRLELEGLGAWTVKPLGDRAEVTEVPTGGDLNGEAFAISTDPATLAQLASGRSPIGALARGALQAPRAAAARRWPSGGSPPTRVRATWRASACPVDPDLVFRSLEYAIEPEWTRGHTFTVAYELVGEGGGAWRVEVDDGTRPRPARRSARAPTPIVRIRYSDWLRLLSGELTPSDAMRLGYTEVEGRIFPVTRMGRWIDRAEGVDGPELAREERQRVLQAAERRQLGEQGELEWRLRRRRRSGRVQAPAGRPDELRAALRALGAAELARPRARLLGRPRALAGQPGGVPAAHRLQHRQLLRRRGAGHRRPGAVPAGRAERRGRGLPGHPAGRRDAPRGLLRPLGERGDGPRVGQLPRPPARDRGSDARPVALPVRRLAAGHRRPDQGEARRPRALRRGHRHLPHGHRGGPGDARAADHDRVHRRITTSIRASTRASAWSSRTSTVTSPSGSAS